MIIKEMYKNIDLDLLSELAEDNDYWEKAEKFIVSVWDRDINTLSQKQVDWVDKIDSEIVRH